MPRRPPGADDPTHTPGRTRLPGIEGGRRTTTCCSDCFDEVRSSARSLSASSAGATSRRGCRERTRVVASTDSPPAARTTCPGTFSPARSSICCGATARRARPCATNSPLSDTARPPSSRSTPGASGTRSTERPSSPSRPWKTDCPTRSWFQSQGRPRVGRFAHACRRTAIEKGSTTSAPRERPETRANTAAREPPDRGGTGDLASRPI